MIVEIKPTEEKLALILQVGDQIIAVQYFVPSWPQGEIQTLQQMIKIAGHIYLVTSSITIQKMK